VSFFFTAQRADAAGDEQLASQCLGACHRVLHEIVTSGGQLDPPLMQLYQQYNNMAGSQPSKT
jgi:hypothetical protein